MKYVQSIVYSHFYALYCSFSSVIHVSESRINKDGMIDVVIYYEFTLA